MKSYLVDTGVPGFKIVNTRGKKVEPYRADIPQIFLVEDIVTPNPDVADSYQNVWMTFRKNGELLQFYRVDVKVLN